ncbi:hypothetical protein PoB_004284100 [Plakobranchus ocellatus]|uniref:Uncharacterized protein n=1 Tax=Plakobranchus ocellatus TaxID=259542 RepID=A0AAV4BBW5_9GAST|nr:hypothetical protein PoB_004284100 [Plakobranchus ocellatus]
MSSKSYTSSMGSFNYMSCIGCMGINLRVNNTKLSIDAKKTNRLGHPNEGKPGGVTPNDRAVVAMAISVIMGMCLTNENVSCFHTNLHTSAAHTGGEREQ